MKKDVFALCCLAIAMLACACARNDRSIEAAKAEAAEKARLAEYNGLQAATDDDCFLMVKSPVSHCVGCSQEVNS